MELGITIDFTLAGKALFHILLLFFSVYGLFLGYHWFTYGTSKNTSTTALALYLLGGAALFLTLAASIRLF